MNRTYLLGVIIAIISTFFYGIMDASVKYTLTSYPIHFSTFYFYTNLLIFLFVIVFLIAKNKLNLLIHERKYFLLFLRGMLSVINFFLAFYVLQYLPLDIYYSIIFTTPIVASIFAVFLLNERFNSIKILSLILGISGIFVINNPFSQNFENKYIVPILISLILACSVSLTGLFTRKFLSKTRGIVILFHSSFYSTLLGFIASIINVGSVKTLQFDSSYFYLILLVSVNCLIGMSLFIKAYKMTPIQIVAPTEYVLMVWGIIFGYFIFHHSTTLATLIGCSIIVISNILSSINLKNKYN